MSSFKSKYRHKPHLLRPPIPHLFHTNKSVTEDDFAVITQAMSRVRTEIAHLDELERIEGDNEAIYRQRLACQEFITKHKNILHWTRRLPPELLIHIFICYSEDGTHIPWTLSQICRKWRFIALSTPQIWRKIPMLGRFEGAEREQRFINFLTNDYLKRSGEKSINFLWHPNITLMQKMWNTLFQHVERWGDVHMIILREADTQLQDRIATLEGRLHSLYSLKLVFHGSWTTIPLSPFLTAPSLRYLMLDTSFFIFADPESQTFKGHLSWNQLTHFTIKCNWLDHFNYALLSSNTNLVYLNITTTLQYDSLSTDTVKPRVSFNTCKYLRLDLSCPRAVPFEGGHHHNILLTRLDFPVLQQLYITYTPSWEGDPRLHMSWITSFIQRHATSLQSIHWDHNKALPPQLNLPNLQVLRLSNSIGAWLNEFVDYLMEYPDYLPSLRKLDILVSIFDQENNELYESLDSLVTVRTSIRGLRLQMHGLDIVNIQWTTLMQLEGWSQSLQEGWEKQIELGEELDALEPWKEVIRTALDNPLEIASKSIHNALRMIESFRPTDAIILHATRIHYLLKRLSESNSTDWPVKWNEEYGLITRAQDLLKHWKIELAEDSTTRKWAMYGNDSVIYVPSDSPLCADPSIWLFGILSDDEIRPEYLSDNWIPEINPTWTYCDKHEDLLYY